jgi:6-phosphofructokinase 1
MMPEIFGACGLTDVRALEILTQYREYLESTIRRKTQNPHGLIVLAEGVGAELEKLGVMIDGQPVRKAESAGQLTAFLGKRLINMAGQPVTTFHIEPRYYVRAYPANAHDQIYCKRLGALAADNALAGFTDFMISQWLTEYVLVPLELVAGGLKRVPTGGIFWKQVVASTGQPSL